MTQFNKGDKIQITDKNHKDYLEVFVVMFNHFDYICYGKDVNQIKSDGKVKPNQITLIKL